MHRNENLGQNRKRGNQGRKPKHRKKWLWQLLVPFRVAAVYGIRLKRLKVRQFIFALFYFWCVFTLKKIYKNLIDRLPNKALEHARPVTIATPVNKPCEAQSRSYWRNLMVKVLWINIWIYSNININKQTNFEYYFWAKVKARHTI